MKNYLYTWTCLLAFSILVNPAMADTITAIDTTAETVLAADTTSAENNDEADTEAKASSGTKPVVYTFTLNDDIMPPSMRLVDRALQEAKEANADFIVMILNTYGGRVDIADSMRTKLLDAEATVAVLVKDNAISAGALISIACDSIYMSKGASIGAATVVSGEDGQQMPDKYQSFMRAKMRSTAETQGRDPRIAEAMVDDRIYIEGIIDSGYTLTFSTEEAIKHGYCEGYAENLSEVLDLMGVEADREIITYKESTLDKVIAVLLSPVLSGILMMVIVFGIYFELQTPGVGFPLMAAITAAVLYFAPLYLEGMAENWEILLFIIGVVLLALEIFVIPGFGVAGISGIILIIASLTLALVQNVAFDFTFSAPGEVTWALLRVILSLGIGLTLLLIFGKSIIHSGPFQKIMLMDTQNTADGYTGVDTKMNDLIGKEGIAVTELRPSGTVEIEDERYDAVSDGEFINRGSKVKVLKMPSSSSVVVRLVREQV